MNRYSEEIVSRLKESTDILSLVGSYLPLRKRGKNYITLCPFHEEKTPSFNVSPERQSFKCFGCGKGGDAITFVQEFEKVEFPQALELLADRIGFRLPSTPGASAAGDQKIQIRRALQFALEQFCRNLGSKEGVAALNYIAKRKITRETVGEFRLGYALPGWDRIRISANKAGFSDANLESAGLLVRGERGSLYDRFRHRLMIPIFDSLNRPVGFGARVLDESKPKYLNSPETPVFRKGDLLYGLERVKNEIEKSGWVGIVEGYTDVILANQAGVKNLVATLGTALTAEHARLLHRYTNSVVLVFDGDEAGQDANARGVEILLQEDLDVRVVVLPDGLDPGDLVEQRGPKALEQALEKKSDYFEFFLERLEKRPDFAAGQGKARAFDEVLGLMLKIPSPVKLDQLFVRVADRWDISEKALRERYWSASPDKRQQDRKSLVSQATKAAGRADMVPVEQELFAVILQDPSLLPAVRERVLPEDFRGEGHGDIFRAMLDLYEQDGTVSWKKLMDRAAKNPCRAAIVEWQERKLEDPAKVAFQLLATLARKRREGQIQKLKQEAKFAKKLGDEATVDARHEQLYRLLKESRTVHGQ